MTEKERNLIIEAEKTNPALASQMRLNAWYNDRIQILEKKLDMIERWKNTLNNN